MMPARGKPNEKLKRIITNLSGKYDSPVFDPHVTLLGGIVGEEKKVIKDFEEFANEFKNINISLSRLADSEAYFKCVFANVKKTNAVMSANKKCRSVFPSVGNSYMPHLSLIYGCYTKKTRNDIKKQLGNEVNALLFPVGSLCLYDTSGEIAYWKNIKSIEVKKLDR
jgi:2'-5' RNA ligase